MGDVSGGFQLQKSGGGTLRLQGAGSWTGGTVVRQGTLQIADGSALPDSGVVSFLQDADVPRRLDLENDEIIGGLSSPAGVTQVTVDLNTATLFVNGPGDFASGVITGGVSGRLAKTGSGALTIRTSNTYSGGTTVAGGELILAAAMGTPLGTGDLLIDAARASGAGSIPGDVTVDDGGTLAGTFSLGSLELMDNGRIELEWLTNTLTVGGISEIGDGTLRVLADAPINPAIGTTWNFLASTGGVEGMFVNPVLPPLPTGKSWLVRYEDTSVALQVVPTQLPGDYNDDLAVNAADYTVWRNSLGQTGANLPADGTGPAGVPDGVVNSLDFLFWKQHYGETVGSSAAAQTNIGGNLPEPSATFLLAAGAAWMFVVGRWPGCRAMS
jgi:autotransporter-associated beta strand protein